MGELELHAKGCIRVKWTGVNFLHPCGCVWEFNYFPFFLVDFLSMRFQICSAFLLLLILQGEFSKKAACSPPECSLNIIQVISWDPLQPTTRTSFLSGLVLRRLPALGLMYNNTVWRVFDVSRVEEEEDSGPTVPRLSKQERAPWEGLLCGCVGPPWPTHPTLRGCVSCRAWTSASTFTIGLE
jgi:hypothetical protein